MQNIEEILSNVSRVIIGKKDVITIILAGILCGGHILIEDVPGTGKTTLARALARTLGCSFRRIQFTPDLMPSDVVGLSIYDREKNEFIFKPGPVFSQFVLADEINRTSPKTQAALLEAMAEGQVTADGVTYPLPEPFIVIATQNPVEYEGTYPLPEAQLDRFMLRVTVGYPGKEDEKFILSLNPGRALEQHVETLTDPAYLMITQKKVENIYLDDILADYIVRLVQATRTNPELLLGASPRAGQHLYRAAKAIAAVEGRDFVLPDDIKKVAGPVLAHRLILQPEARLKGKTTADLIRDILRDTEVPVYYHDQDQ